MIQSQIIIKPIVTEKVNKQTETSRRYSFQVDKRANKLEIKAAVESFYGVKVEDVNTLVVPAKNRVRFTTRGVMKGRKSGYKKAIVTIAEGENIDFYAY
jgi:large subunit ribosomal protein L23